MKLIGTLILAVSIREKQEEIGLVFGRLSYARAMIELWADVELKDTIVVAMPKLTGEGFIREECPKNISVGEMKNLKKPSQTPRDVPVGQKVRFKLIKQVYQPVSKKPTANTSGTKKKNMEPNTEVSKSNPFDVLTSVKNDVDLGTNGGTSNLASQEANSSGSSFWNVNSPITTPIIEKNDKIEKLIIDGKVTWVDDKGKPLEKVKSSSDYDSEDEVALFDNEMASFWLRRMAPPSSNYVPGPEHPPLTNYVPSPEYLKYLVPSDNDIPIEDLPLPTDALPMALSPGYIADSDPKEDPDEDPQDDPEVDPADYPAIGGDEEEEESFGDDADDKEEHLALADSSAISIDEPVPSAEEIEPFETDNCCYTTIIITTTIFTYSIIISTPQIPSPPLPLPSPPLLLPATGRRKDVPEADVPPQKGLCLTALAPRFKRHIFTRKRVSTIPNTTYQPSSIRHIHDDNYAEIGRYLYFGSVYRFDYKLYAYSKGYTPNTPYWPNPIQSLRMMSCLSLKNDMSFQDNVFDSIVNTTYSVIKLFDSSILQVNMDDPNINMEEYIRFEEEKARKRGKVFNWETAKYGKIWYDEDVYDLRSVETEFPAIVFNDKLTSHETLSCEPTVMACNYLNKGMSFIILIKNLYVPFGISFNLKLFYKDGIKLGQV
uniref:Uncharacterized protein n=1 Tax=Tanacetum cinerariifolium TaxID=118510 RepID=A0A699GNE3_TANCI|nr:hypothetical protein [Tanacetum cinerariifolium]